MASNHLDSDQGVSGVAQTANLGSSTSVSSGAAKIFREFKWGLLTLFILMAVVVGLVYDGGRNKKKNDAAAVAPSPRLDAGIAEPNLTGDNSAPITPNGGLPNPVNGPLGVGAAGGLGGGNSAVVGGVNDAPGRTRAQLLDDGPDNWNPAPIPEQHITRPTARNGAPLAPGDDTRGIQTRDRAPTQNDPRHNDTHTQQPAPHAPETNAGKIYLVKAGDSLSKIASSNQLGKNGIKLLIEANKETLPNPDRLREGMKLRIPGPGSSAAVSDSTAHLTARDAHSSDRRVLTETRSDKNAAAQSDTYVVQPGDSLERIARRVLNDSRKWKDIMEWNKDKLADPTKLKAGMALRIHGSSGASPASAEGVRYQNNPVRASAEPPSSTSVEPSFVPEAEVAPIPISPVSASRKISMKNDKFEREENTPAGKSAKLPEPDNLPNAMLLN